MDDYRGLLTGVRVLDMSIWRPGPYCTQLLVNLGADVLKIEPPGGDPMRGFPELFASLNAHKRSVVLDLKQEEGRARAHELVADADVLVEGFRPGVAERLGMGARETRAINPTLVYCSVSGFGQTGPLAQAPGHDVNYQATAAVLAPDGGPAIEGKLPIADLTGGVFAALAVCAALVGRSSNGEGEQADVSMTDTLATWTGPFESTKLEGAGDDFKGLPTYGVFTTADGREVVLGIINEEHFWATVCDAFGFDDLRDVDTLARIKRGGEVRGRIAAAIAARKLDDVLADLEGAPISGVLTRAEMLKHPQLVHRGLVGETAPDGIPHMGYPVLFADHPGRPPGTSPTLGQHQDEGFTPRAEPSSSA